MYGTMAWQPLVMALLFLVPFQMLGSGDVPNSGLLPSKSLLDLSETQYKSLNIITNRQQTNMENLSFPLQL